MQIGLAEAGTAKKITCLKTTAFVCRYIPHAQRQFRLLKGKVIVHYRKMFGQYTICLFQSRSMERHLKDVFTR